MLEYLTGTGAIALAASSVMVDPGGGKSGESAGGGNKARGNGGGAPHVAQAKDVDDRQTAKNRGNGPPRKVAIPRGNADRGPERSADRRESSRVANSGQSGRPVRGPDRTNRGNRVVDSRQRTVNRGNRDDLSNRAGRMPSLGGPVA